MMKKICPLCNRNEATKTNCHIFPRFLGESMRKSKKSSRVIEIKKDMFFKKISTKQDTAKENYLLCPKCETFINDNYERIVASSFYNKRNELNTYSRYSDGNGFTYRIYDNLDYQCFKVFCYSLLFRASVASVSPFKEFKLPNSYELFLSDQILGKGSFEDIPLYVFILNGDFDHTRNLQGIRYYDRSPTAIHLIANDIMIILDLFANTKSLEYYNSICSTNGKIRFCEVSSCEWERWLQIILYKVECRIKSDLIGEIISLLKNK